MKRIILFFSLILSTSVYAKITAYFSPNSISQGNSVELIFASDTPFKGVPNIDILKNDFLIGGQQKKQSSQWINGKGTTTYQLSYTLFPKKSGKITVQGLKVATESIPQLTLTVQSDAAFETAGKINLTVKCPSDKIYLAQKIFCSVVVDDTMGLVGGKIVPPDTPSLGTWEKILAPIPTTASTQTPTPHYQGIFAFTPKKSGKIEIAPFTLEGEVVLKTNKPSTYTSIFDLLTLGVRSLSTKQVVVQSEPFTLTVQPKPANYTGWWLPSSEVTLSEQYDLPPVIYVGDPVLRTLTLNAKDVIANDLPVPNVTSSNGLKVYPNPEQRKDTKNGAELTVTLAFVPTIAGEITLPAIEVPWFDVKSEKIKVASVPARKIAVIGNSSSVQPVTTTIPPPEPIAQKLEIPATPSEIPSQFSWQIVICAVTIAFLLGILLTYFALKRNNKNNEQKKKKKPLPDLYPF